MGTHVRRDACEERLRPRHDGIVYLRGADARAQASIDAERARARREVRRQHLGKQHVRAVHVGHVEIGREDANYLNGLAVELDAASDSVSIAAEARLPEGM